MRKLFILILLFGCSKKSEVKPVENIIYTSHLVEFLVESESNPIKIKYGIVGDSDSEINYYTFNSFSDNEIVSKPHTDRLFYLSVKNILNTFDTIKIKIFVDNILQSQTTGVDSVYTNLLW